MLTEEQKESQKNEILQKIKSEIDAWYYMRNSNLSTIQYNILIGILEKYMK